MPNYAGQTQTRIMAYKRLWENRNCMLQIARSLKYFTHIAWMSWYDTWILQAAIYWSVYYDYHELREKKKQKENNCDHKLGLWAKIVPLGVAQGGDALRSCVWWKIWAWYSLTLGQARTEVVRPALKRTAPPPLQEKQTLILRCMPKIQ